MTPLPQREAGFLRAVVEAARWQGWLVHHCRPAMKGDGSWSTPIQGDPGFPDLILVHPGRGAVLAVELKVASRLTPSQAGWLEAFEKAGVPAVVWTPKHWDLIRATLGAGVTSER